MSWKKIVAGIAPTLATALGGPFAGMAVKAIGNKLIGKENAQEAEVEAALLSATPDQLLKIKELDSEFALEMKRLDVDLEALAVSDRSSARELFRVNIWPQITLSVLFIGGYFTILWALFGGTIMLDPSIRDMSNILLGVLTAGIPMILRFWFGGSPQDEAHMDRIYNSTPKR